MFSNEMAVYVTQRVLN